MAVILFLLKAVGIILLAVLVLLLLLLAVVLFVPVRYEVGGAAEEQFRLDGKVSWLFRILSVHFSWEGKKLMSEIRIFGIRKGLKQDREEENAEVSRHSGKKKKRTKEKKKQKEAAPAGTKTGGEPGGSAERADPPGRPEDTDLRQLRDETNDTVAEASGGEDRICRTEITDSGSAGMDTAAKDSGNIEVSTAAEDDSAEAETVTTPRNHKVIPRKISDILQKISDIPRKINDILRKTSDIPQKIDDLKTRVWDEAAKTSYGLMWSELLYLLRHFRFRKIQTDLTFSLGDPARTGQALGILAMLPFLYRYNADVRPDFESERWYVRGTFCAKGHAHLLHLLVSAFRLWRKKELRTFVKRLLK